MSATTSIALVDDHPLMVEAIVSLLKRSRKDCRVIATGTCARDVVEIVETRQPNIVIVDLNMTGDVYAALSRVTRSSPRTKIVAFTASNGVETAIRAFDAGAHGYVLKGGSSHDLLQAIDTVQRDETFLTQSFASEVIAALRDASARQATAPPIKLSVRESQIIRHLLKGKTNKEIANELTISEKTVKHYMTILMQKLNVRNRLEVVIAAQKIGDCGGLRRLANVATGRGGFDGPRVKRFFPDGP